MNLSFCLSEWFKYEKCKSQLYEKSMSETLYSKFSGEVHWQDVYPLGTEWERLQSLGLKVSNMIYRDAAFMDPEAPSRFQKVLEFCNTWNIPQITFQDATEYQGDSQSLKIRLADRFMDSKKWADYLSFFEQLGEMCQKNQRRLLLGNRSGMLLEKMSDFEKLKEGTSFGFYIDIPHFLYANETISHVDLEVKNKIQGIRLGSYNPCAWVATRQNQLSWSETMNFNVFQPFKIEHKKMLGKYIRLIEETASQIQTLSLGHDTGHESADPLTSFLIAEATYREVFSTTPQVKARAS